MRGGSDGIGVAGFADAQVLHADGSYEAPGIILDLTGAAHGLGIQVGGVFTIECFSAGGQRRWVDSLKNGIVNGALDDVLNVYLRDQSPAANWYIGLLDNAAFTALAAGDTIASHAGWAEFTGFSDATRGAWAPGASSGQSVTNATSVDFHITASATLRGLFLVSDSTKSGTAGKLFSTAAFTGGLQVVNSGDTLKVTYTVSAAST